MQTCLFMTDGEWVKYWAKWDGWPLRSTERCGHRLDPLMGECSLPTSHAGPHIGYSSHYPDPIGRICIRHGDETVYLFKE